MILNKAKKAWSAPLCGDLQWAKQQIHPDKYSDNGSEPAFKVAEQPARCFASPCRYIVAFLADGSRAIPRRFFGPDMTPL
ncbi:MAG: hypothetical protein MK171_04930 [Pirellulales bacterium]|nr:hypothetical protein [Pirellulales bacterium]